MTGNMVPDFKKIFCLTSESKVKPKLRCVFLEVMSDSREYLKISSTVSHRMTSDDAR